MPIAFPETRGPAAPEMPPRKRWTRAECEAIEAAGVLAQQRYELIEGELISKMGKKRPHVNSLALVMHWLVEVFGFEFVNQEAPIDVAPEDTPTSEPEPDLIVLKRPLLEFQTANPRAEDLRLVVEVSDMTLQFDLTIKAALYARAGIREYWVVDLANRRLLIHRDPGSGGYVSSASYGSEESVAPLAAPEAWFRVSRAFQME